MRTSIVLLITIVFSLPLKAQQPEEVQRANHYLDHIVLGVNDLDQGIVAFKRLTGTNPKKDGSDAQLGTHSAIVGLGENMFLEIIAPDPKVDSESIDQELKALVFDRLQTMDELTPFGWAVGTSNLERTTFFARRAGSRSSEIMTGSRKRGWGRKEEWTWVRVTSPESRVMPIFVQWADESKRPQERAPKGCTLEELRVYSRSFKSVHALAATMQVDADVEGADEDALGFEMECPNGEVNFEPTSLMGQSNQPLPGMKKN
jgi:hypothetical protein